MKDTGCQWMAFCAIKYVTNILLFCCSYWIRYDYFPMKFIVQCFAGNGPCGLLRRLRRKYRGGCVSIDRYPATTTTKIKQYNAITLARLNCFYYICGALIGCWKASYITRGLENNIHGWSILKGVIFTWYHHRHCHDTPIWTVIKTADMRHPAWDLITWDYIDRQCTDINEQSSIYRTIVEDNFPRLISKPLRVVSEAPIICKCSFTIIFSN